MEKKKKERDQIKGVLYLIVYQVEFEAGEADRSAPGPPDNAKSSVAVSAGAI